jgi:pimeloyl-ACP methyl ester carboxylesterase
MSLYEAFSQPIDEFASHEADKNIYRVVDSPLKTIISVKTPFYGQIRTSGNKLVTTNEFKISAAVFGNKGPKVLIIHGVPTNKRQWYPVAERLAPFCNVVCIDMLGMGESSMPLNYGMKVDEDMMLEYKLSKINKPWDWVNDTCYIHQIAKKMFGDEKFIFLGDDWGGGIVSHFAAKYDNIILASGLLDPIAFDGYPVSEIQAIGRASQIKDEKTFQMVMGSIDQTMVQIFKTMVHKPDNVYNQYTLRSIKGTYVDTDYERSEYKHGEDADSLTLRLRWDAIRVGTLFAF